MFFIFVILAAFCANEIVWADSSTETPKKTQTPKNPSEGRKPSSRSLFPPFGEAGSMLGKEDQKEEEDQEDHFEESMIEKEDQENHPPSQNATPKGTPNTTPKKGHPSRNTGQQGVLPPLFPSFKTSLSLAIGSPPRESRSQFDNDDAATGPLKSDQISAFAYIDSGVKSILDTYPFPDVVLHKTIDKFDQSDVVEILYSLGLIDQTRGYEISTYEIKVTSAFAHKVIQVYFPLQMVPLAASAAPEEKVVIHTPPRVKRPRSENNSLFGDEFRVKRNESAAPEAREDPEEEVAALEAIKNPEEEAVIHTPPRKHAKPNGKLTFVLKFHRPAVLNKLTLKSEIGVKLHATLGAQERDLFPNLPKLAFTEQIVKVHFKSPDLRGSEQSFYVSVMHAAEGYSVKSVLEDYFKESNKVKESNNEKLLQLAYELGQTIGTFHGYHAIKNDGAAFIRSIQEERKKREREREESVSAQEKAQPCYTFSTINHNDLHTNNIFVDLKHGRFVFTLIDLESLFLGALSMHHNANDLIKIKSSLEKVLKPHNEIKNSVLAEFDKGYNQGVDTVFDHYQREAQLEGRYFPSTSTSTLTSAAALWEEEDATMGGGF